MKKTLAISNLLSVVLVIAVNALSQIQRWNDTSVGEISDKYDNLFTPAGYAFSIWSLIFIAILGMAVYGIVQVYTQSMHTQWIEDMSWYFAAANVLNASWVVAFTYELVALSLLIMLGILSCLLTIIVRARVATYAAPRHVIIAQWWPVSLYAGWITVATIANVTLVLVDWGYSGAPISPAIWAIIMIITATGLYAYMLYTRNVRLYALVGVWALVAIYVRRSADYPGIAYVASICAVVLLVVIIWHRLRPGATDIS